MGIILKHAVREMLESKARLYLIVFAIMLSSAMFFASMTISDTLVTMRMDQWRSSYGYSDIVVHSRGNGAPAYFSMQGVRQYSQYLEYMAGSLTGYGLFRTGVHNRHGEAEQKGMTLLGMELEELQQVTPIILSRESNLYPFQGMKAVISQRASEILGLHPGDRMVIEINGVKRKLTVSGIALPAGPFLSEGQSFCVLLPRDTLAAMYNVRGKVDMLYLKLKDRMAVNILLVKLTRQYSRHIVRQSFTTAEVKRETDRIAVPILIITVILSCMSVYIIHSTFRIILLRKLPILGTFRSVGSTKARLGSLLMLESMLYGTVGGALGCGGGILLLNVLAWVLNPSKGEGVRNLAAFSPVGLLTAFLLAFVLSIVGSVGPIWKIASLPIRSIVLGTEGHASAGEGKRALAGGVLAVFSLSVPFIIHGEQALLLHTVCIVFFLAAVILLLPYFLGVVLGSMKRLLLQLPAYSGTLALQNLAAGRSLQSCIAMLVIGVASLFMINTVNYSSWKETAACFERTGYQLVLNMEGVNAGTLKLIEAVPGVEQAYGNLYTRGVEVMGKDSTLWHVQGIDVRSFSQWHRLRTDMGEDEVQEALKGGRNILLTRALKDRLEVEAGDTLLLRSYAGGTARTVSYRIAGFFDNFLPGRWSYALISRENFRQDFQAKSYSPVYIKTSLNELQVADNLRAEFARRKPVIETVAGMKKETEESNSQLFVILNTFSILTVLLGSFGILNNIVISLVQRKASLAVLRSVGMSRFQMLRMLLTEAFCIGMAGAAAGVGAGTAAVLVLIPQVLKAMDIEEKIYFSSELAAGCGILAIVIAVAASSGPAAGMSRMDILRSIRQE